jgi:membrane-associated protease RseP (regulator of RpoE activity)
MKLFVLVITGAWILLAAATAAMAQAPGQGWLGVQVAPVTKADADALGWEELHGVKVIKTAPGGPAEQAGLMPGDLILSVGGVEADDVKAFVASVSSKGANAKVKLRLIRNGKEKVVPVILGARPLDQAQTQMPAPQSRAAAADLKWDAISISGAPPTRIKGHIILIANSDYKFFTKLEGPGRDINAAASAFSQIGFRTTVLTDPRKEQILDAIKTAGAGGEQQLIGLYYSGHAAEINNQNTVVLTGFDPSSKSYTDSLLPVQTVLSYLTSSNDQAAARFRST